MNVFGKMPVLTEFGLIVLLAWMVSGWLLPGEDKMQPAAIMQNTKVSAVALPDLAELLAVPLFGNLRPRLSRLPRPLRKR